MSGALDGIRVIDFGQYIAGPLAAMLLVDQGADVVRVDPPDGPRMRTRANATWNRGKRSIVLDLRRDEDRTIAQRLIASADAVVENFRPGVMDRLGLGPAEMTAANPGLIYCSLPGFASDDPRRDLAAWEGVVGAATDTYRPAVAGGSDRPVYTALPIASNFAAFLGATSITMALIARERNGLGQRIAVPLFDAMFTAIGFRGFLMPGLAGATPPPDITGGGQYECADGRWVHFANFNPRFLEWLVDACDKASWRDDGLLDRERLAQEPDLVRELRRRLSELFKTRTAAGWEEFASVIGCPVIICRTSPEWLHTPHARESGTVIETDDPELGPLLQPGVPVRLSKTPGAVRGPRHLLDADRDVILEEAASGARPVRRDSAGHGGHAEPALHGVRVLDLTQIWAGPVAGRTLAEFGADVIKINSPSASINTHEDVNRGKRTLLLDLSKPSGLGLFWRLIEDADVVLQNFRFGVAERLGIGYEQVRARKPDIIYASVSAYGYGGSWRDRRGYEPQGQATAGLQERFGGDGPPTTQPFALNDYGTGVLGAFAIALALFHRSRTGEGQHVDAALASTATMHASPYLLEYEGKRWDEPRGQDAPGSGPLQRLYQASDGWFFLGAAERDRQRLGEMPGLAGLGDRQGAALEAFLESRLAAAPVATWVERLTAAGMGAQPVTSVQQLIADPWVQSHGLSLTRDHVGVGAVTTIGPAPRLSRTPVTAGRPAAQPGADAAEILAEAGLGDQLQRLVAEGAISVPGVMATG